MLSQSKIKLAADYSEVALDNFAKQTVTTVSGETFLENKVLHQEVFGPYSIIVQCDNEAQLEEIISNIESEIPFEAVSEDYSFTLKISEYAPYICAAVHDGHQFRKSLWANCLHTEYERWYEEDPCTSQIVASHPIVLTGCDSRFEYDLNRPPDGAIYADAWGKQLWKAPLSAEEYDLSMHKHGSFYNVVHALIYQIEKEIR